MSVKELKLKMHMKNTGKQDYTLGLPITLTISKITIMEKETIFIMETV